MGKTDLDKEVIEFSDRKFREKRWTHSVALLPRCFTPLYMFAAVKPWVLVKFLSPRLRRQRLLILDFGCGAGAHAKLLSNYFPNSRVIGIDISTYAIRYAKAEHRGVTFIVGDCQHLPFKTSTFDLIYTADVFAHIPDLRLAIKELSRTLKVGGQAIIYAETNALSKGRRRIIEKTVEDPWCKLDGHISLHSEIQLRNILEAEGLKLLKWKYHPESYLLLRWDSRLDHAYPQLRQHFKLTRMIGKSISALRSLPLLRYLAAILLATLTHTLLRFQKRDVGGVYFYVEKVQ